MMEPFKVFSMFTSQTRRMPIGIGGRIFNRTLIRPLSISHKIEPVELSYDRHDPTNRTKAEPYKHPIIFLHGLFGSKSNNRTVSKVLARDMNTSVFCLDLRNHGDSPHNELHTYPALAADVKHFIEEQNLGPVTIIGHSMGAKTAMVLALQNPELVEYLIPVDNSPVDVALESYFPRYLIGMKEIERARVHSLKEAYKIMAKYENSLVIQQFLLSNLKKIHTGEYHFRIPLDILSKSLSHLGDFPCHPDKERFTKPTLIIRGTRSKYVPDEVLPAIGQFFPRFSIQDIDSGHWVISEKPQEFIAAVERFLLEEEEEANE